MKNIVTTEEARKGFYPTPPKLAEKLLEGIDWDYISDVLEPSAGKGNLVKEVAKQFKRNYRRGGWSSRKVGVDCVEIDPYLRSILTYEFCGGRYDDLLERGRNIEHLRKYDNTTHSYEYPDGLREEYGEVEKERDLLNSLSCHIVYDNFLTFQSRKRYGLIVMNPPFADGDVHLLKAIELQQRHGGLIRCLLNAETILNPYTNRRKVLADKLKELGATVEYVDGGFSAAERSTDVTAALIRIDIPEEKRKSSIYDRLRKAAELEDTPETNVTDMTVADFMEQIVAWYNVEVDAGLELIREYEAMMPYILTSFDKEGHFGNTTLTLCVGEPGRMSQGTRPDVNQYLRIVRMKYWRALLSNKEFIGKLTSNLRSKYYDMVGELQEYDFTLFNIQQISVQMNAEMGKGIQETIVALFDRMTQEYSWYPECAKNIHYYNGWKTNKVHKINSKVILPVSGMFSSYSWEKDTFSVREAESTISDIEKVFDYLDGNMTAAVDLHGVLQSACDAGQTRNIPCKYFFVTLYKKGTMHIKFRDQDLVDRFNIYCCRKKNWLPPNYGKASYADMTKEEKTVVDGFHGDGTVGAGESAYQAVMLRSDYYLSEPKNELPALASAT